MNKKTYKLIFIIVFFIMCAVPSTLLLFGYKNANYENRVLSKLTSPIDENGVNLSFPSEFDSFLLDNFAFREQMVTAFNILTINVFDETLNEKTVAGKDGWLFFKETLNDYLGKDVLSEKSIERIAKVLLLQQEYLDKKGINFVFTVAPNKSSIYPQYMPDYLVRQSDTKNIELLETEMKRLGVNFLNLESEIKANLDLGQLYYKEDTHWNDLGALVAYRAIMGKVTKYSVSYDKYENVSTEEVYDYGGDLHYFVLPSLKGGTEQIKLLIDTKYTSDRPVNLERDVTNGTSSDKNDFRLMIFRDSFGKALFPLISSNTGRAFYSAEFPYNYSHIESEQPDAVLIELVERNIDELISTAPNMEAPYYTVSGNKLGTIEAYIKIKTVSKSVKVSGYFDPNYFDTASDSIVLRLMGDKEYTFEAFPILEEEHETDAINRFGGDGENGGFSLTLPKDILPGEYKAFVIISSSKGYYESDNLGNIVIK